jgi:hypothetical protein
MNKACLKQLASDIKEKYGNEISDSIFGDINEIDNGHKAIASWFSNFVKSLDNLDDKEFVKKMLTDRSPCIWKEGERVEIIRKSYEESQSFEEFASLLGERSVGDRVEFNDNVLYLIKNPVDKKDIGSCGKGCHCALACHTEEYISDIFCHCCTVGFCGRPFRKVFGDDIRVEFIESFITNGNPCKTAIYVPKKANW